MSTTAEYIPVVVDDLHNAKSDSGESTSHLARFDLQKLVASHEKLRAAVQKEHVEPHTIVMLSPGPL